MLGRAAAAVARGPGAAEGLESLADGSFGRPTVRRDGSERRGLKGLGMVAPRRSVRSGTGRVKPPGPLHRRGPRCPARPGARTTRGRPRSPMRAAPLHTEAGQDGGVQELLSSF